MNVGLEVQCNAATIANTKRTKGSLFTYCFGIDITRYIGNKKVHYFLLNFCGVGAKWIIKYLGLVLAELIQIICIFIFVHK